jgi:phosphatidylglycerol lysyltransferase
LLLMSKEQGYKTCDLGMAPMSGFQESEAATLEERLVHIFFSHLNFLFSFSGLRHFKSKFATGWEPRYAVFQRFVDLPKLAIALQRVSRVPRGKRRLHRVLSRPLIARIIRPRKMQSPTQREETVTIQ